jgi:hypothetical protein
MSALFRARIDNMEAESLRLRQFIIHPDQSNFYATLPFLFYVLWQGLFEGGESEPFDIASNDPDFEDRIRTQSEKVLATASFEGFENHPRDVDFEAMDDDAFDAYWENEAGLPQALIEVEFLEGRMPPSLKVGQVWETSAWNL